MEVKTMNLKELKRTISRRNLLLEFSCVRAGFYLFYDSFNIRGVINGREVFLHRAF